LFRIKYRFATHNFIYSTVEWGSGDKEQDIKRDDQLYVVV